MEHKNEPVSTYHEVQFGGTLYRITSGHMGILDFITAFEALTVR